MPRPRKNKIVEDAAAAVETVKEHVAAKAAAKDSAKKAHATHAKTNTSVILQAYSSEWNISDCKKRVMEAIAADGHKESEIDAVTIYLKPEENKIYYVANENIAGSIEL